MGGFGSPLRKKKKVAGLWHSIFCIISIRPQQCFDWYFWWKMSLVLTICHIIRLYKCEHCTLTYSNKITLVWFLHFFFYLGGRWFSKILRNIWGWYVKILTIPYRGGWVVWKRPKTPLRNIKMAPYAKTVQPIYHKFWHKFLLLSTTEIQK